MQQSLQKVESDHGIYGITGGGRAYSDPADAGENFEDYLNFPETIEASVVEYKNVDHQKNNADRDKGAEDEKAAARP